jgi:ubiquinone/menaquinone biosynthesis C-methylase UbiE
MIAMENKNKIAAWSSYWSEGNITSFPNLFAENYGGDIFRFWSETFTMLREHNRVLDICTGNGAIAILARDDVNRRNISCDIHAIDAAKIQSHELQDSDATFNNIKFHSGVSVENTRFSDNYFNLIVGQFALEYCNIEDGIKELSRIIRKDGAIVLMMHHVSSITVKNTRDIIDIANVFLKEPNIFFRLRKYVEQYSRQKIKDSPKVIQKRNQLMVSFNEINKLFRQFPNNSFLQVTLGNIKYFAERVHNNSSIQIAEIRQFEKIIKHHLIRMQDQRDAASDIEKMLELEGLFYRYGFLSVKFKPYYLDGVLFAWTLKVERGDCE